MSREITKIIEIAQTSENIFNALLNPSAIAEWWGAKTAIVIKENKGIYAVSWGTSVDDPDFVTISMIKNYEPPKKLSLEYLNYVAKTGGLPFEADMIVHFTIIPINESNFALEIKQTGIPKDQIADDYYEACKTGWSQVLNNIKKYCEKPIKTESEE